jgi:shikimate kinase
VRRHIVLIGLPGAGKSTVGREVARLLDAVFRDLDSSIVAAAGCTIGELFRDQGERAFRALEAAAMEQVLGEPALVVAAGGGWAAEPGNLELASRRGALVVHLDCSPDAAAQRLAGSDDRPLLRDDTPAALRRLAEARRPFYARADARVESTDRGVEMVAAEIVALARSEGGW